MWAYDQSDNFPFSVAFCLKTWNSLRKPYLRTGHKMGCTGLIEFEQGQGFELSGGIIEIARMIYFSCYLLLGATASSN